MQYDILMARISGYLCSTKSVFFPQKISPPRAAIIPQGFSSSKNVKISYFFSAKIVFRQGSLRGGSNMITTVSHLIKQIT